MFALPLEARKCVIFSDNKLSNIFKPSNTDETIDFDTL
jgi:hypothetical protein